MEAMSQFVEDVKERNGAVTMVGHVLNMINPLRVGSRLLYSFVMTYSHSTPVSLYLEVELS